MEYLLAFLTNAQLMAVLAAFIIANIAIRLHHQRSLMKITVDAIAPACKTPGDWADCLRIINEQRRRDIDTVLERDFSRALQKR